MVEDSTIILHCETQRNRNGIGVKKTVESIQIKLLLSNWNLSPFIIKFVIIIAYMVLRNFSCQYHVNIMMARGDTLRLVQFGHMFTTEHEEVGPDKCVSLDIISVRGKTVNAGEKTYHTLVRTQR